ncbi:MAG: sulfurtransferase [Lachnospirales bacterium]
MKKNIVSKLLFVVLGTSLLASCSSNTTETTTDEATTDTAVEEPATDVAEETEPEETEPEVVEEPTVEAIDARQVYVSPEWVNSLMAGEQEESDDYVILEVSWGEEADSATYSTGHITGSYHLNTDDIEEPELWNIRTPEEIEAVLLEYGISKDTTVVVYGANGTDAADDRFAFTAIWAGVENVKSIDGGLDAWVGAGYEVETTSNTPTAIESFGATVPAHPEYLTTMTDALDKVVADPNFKLVSVRSQAEFLGETSGYGYINKAGEPMGAIWGHDTDDGSYNNADGTMVDISVLEGYLAESSASLDNELAFYCGTGWRATMPFLLAYQEGYDNVSLYDGGWFEWQMTDSNPVQLGDPTSADVVYTTVGELVEITN